MFFELNDMKQTILVGLLGGCCLFSAVPCPSPGQSQVVDCIVAVVNTQVITLTELRVVDAFGVFSTEEKPEKMDRLSFLLNKMIDQKVVIDLAAEKMPADKEKVEQAFQRLAERLGQEKTSTELAGFGLTVDDLKSYLEEKVTCETIIASRFLQTATVTLKEIETYYAESYVPAQKVLGLEPRPMVEILSTIESEIKKARVEAQVALWIKNLRKKAEIEIRTDCLKKY
jgi:hypothetical protein